jgi:hypothetical protein
MRGEMSDERGGFTTCDSIKGLMTYFIKILNL